MPPEASVLRAVAVVDCRGLFDSVVARHVGKILDRSMLLFNALENQQTRSYQQAAAALDELLAQPENEDLAAHFSYPWPGGHESVYVAR